MEFDVIISDSRTKTKTRDIWGDITDSQIAKKVEPGAFQATEVEQSKAVIMDAGEEIAICKMSQLPRGIARVRNSKGSFHE